MRRYLNIMQKETMDYTTIHPLCASQAHLIDLHLWRGAPENLDEHHPVQILVNHGYVVGFCPARLQPTWSAYRVAFATRDVDFARPIMYHDDLRLAQEYRIGRSTFGKLGGIPLDVGHMTPNEVINRQFGRLAQMETFLMSNMSPQYGALNRGVWMKLETAIREIKDEDGKDHVWAIVSPVFGEQSPTVYRGQNKHVPVPDAYFCVIVDPHTYPYDTPSKVALDYFIIPQIAPSNTNPEDYPSTLEEVEARTKLKFFPAWSRELPKGSVAKVFVVSESRIQRALQTVKLDQVPAEHLIRETRSEATSIDDLIKELEGEATRIQEQGHALSDTDLSRLQMIQHTISWLHRANALLKPAKAPIKPVNVITYHITKDLGDKLKLGARTACNFWNRYIQPKYSIVIRLGTFTENSNTIACAYEPYSKDGVKYGRIEFNTKYLGEFTDAETATTIIHEIGHTLGIGWEDWDELYDHATGRFYPDAIARLATLESMVVELDGGPGTEFAHWDEQLFDKELMTGYKDNGEHVLPVTIDIMEVLGHTVTRRLEERTPLRGLLEEAASMVFSRQDEVRYLDREHFIETEVFETIPHHNEA